MNDDMKDPAYFIGCTCEHASEQHGWGMCNIEGCNCLGGWWEE